MISAPTVLVLGAGASVPYGFPTGVQLRTNMIRRNPASEPSIVEVLNQLNFNRKTALRFHKELARCGLKSVDQLLEQREDLRQIGKTLIAIELVQCESDSRLFAAGQDWYRYLYAYLTDGLKEWSDIGRNKLTVVTYNYDRSLEYFLYNAVGSGARTSLKEAANLVRPIEIIHLHGLLGHPSFHLGASETERPYTSELTPQAVLAATKGIKIIHEGDPQGEDYERARLAIERSERVVFLGFGYDSTNVIRLLEGNGIGGRKRKQYFGSCYGVTPSEQERSIRGPMRNLGVDINLGSPGSDSLTYIRNNVNAVF